MSVDSQHVPLLGDGTAHFSPAADDLLGFHSSVDARGRVVHLRGELDAYTRNVAFNACFSGGEVAAVVDLGALRFMDSGGYQALVAVEKVAHGFGRTLVFDGVASQPARLLALVKMFADADADTDGGGVQDVSRKAGPQGAWPA